MMMGVSSILNAKDISDQKTKESLSPLKDAIRLSIYESCFIRWLNLKSNGLNDTDLNTLLMSCLTRGVDAAKRQFKIDFNLIEP
jgi:hypothetical protein